MTLSPTSFGGLPILVIVTVGPALMWLAIGAIIYLAGRKHYTNGYPIQSGDRHEGEGKG